MQLSVAEDEVRRAAEVEVEQPTTVVSSLVSAPVYADVGCGASINAGQAACGPGLGGAQHSACRSLQAGMLFWLACSPAVHATDQLLLPFAACSLPPASSHPWHSSSRSRWLPHPSPSCPDPKQHRRCPQCQPQQHKHKHKRQGRGPEVQAGGAGGATMRPLLAAAQPVAAGAAATGAAELEQALVLRCSRRQQQRQRQWSQHRCLPHSRAKASLVWWLCRGLPPHHRCPRHLPPRADATALVARVPQRSWLRRQ